ncbi:spore germination protein KC/spore germination protein [Tumebacillus sp. BK434]|uniref:Ger(x)C family spore germination protein n=1 Tax=Tumebacillus sp. BK434 TaxID=2512169 RepID=UPI001047B270|nr:Ger(x)C family spore germination protein [Tumebacillus sp. BK434]TCP57618.1 spore germination protein KC/spore germination protein [Tumebacillus sp. BK434]
MRNKRVLLVAITLLLALTQTGCWDRTEVNDIAIVLATAYDLEEDGKFRVSVQLPLPGQLGGNTGGGGGTSGSTSFYVDSETGVSIRDASERLQQRMPRQLFYAHRRVMVIGQEFARAGIRPVFDAAARIPENRLTASIVIAGGKGYELLNRQPRFERFSSEGIREIVNAESVFNATIKDVAQNLSLTGIDALIPIVVSHASEGTEQKNKEVQFGNYAAFHDDKMTGTLKGEGIEGIRWLKERIKPYSVTLYMDGDKTVLVNVYKGNSSVKPVRRKDHFHYQVKVNATAYVLENLDGIDLSSPDSIQTLNRAMEARIRESVLAAAKDMQRMNSDFCGLGLVIARKYPQEWRNTYHKQWGDELQKATFDVQAKVNISRIGLTSENLAKKGEKE